MVDWGHQYTVDWPIGLAILARGPRIIFFHASPFLSIAETVHVYQMKSGTTSDFQ